MANYKHLELLNEGVGVWNQWRKMNPHIKPNLSKANLAGEDLESINLSGANLSETILCGATLSHANLFEANLYKARLEEADLSEAVLMDANLSKAHMNGTLLEGTNLVNANLSYTVLSNADLTWAKLYEANLEGADLFKATLSHADLKYANLAKADLEMADLRNAILVETNLKEANLSECYVYGVAAWKLKLEGARQANLLISSMNEPDITVDNLEVAQFIYLLIHNEKIRTVIDTITSKAVLILGRFSSKRKEILNTIRDELRKRDYLPILFDFYKPQDRDSIETIITLAGLSKFIIADISNPKSTPLESHVVIPNIMIPFVPIIKRGELPFSMFGDLQNKYEWVLATVSYRNKKELIDNFENAILKRAEDKYQELRIKKLREIQSPIPISELNERNHK